MLRRFIALAVFAFPLLLPIGTTHGEDGYWLDLYAGEQVPQASVVDDLSSASVVYVGEVHTIARHHRTQLELLEALHKAGKPLALGLEQIQADSQPLADRFNQGELDFDGLAQEMQWAKKWKNYEQYRPICEFAQKAGIPLIGLNAPAETIRAIGRGGFDSLSPEQRSQLPQDIVFTDPSYEKLMNMLLSVHMTMDPEKLRPIFEAQVARDETMAANVVKAMKDADGKDRAVFVICGRGHISYGLGTPDRVSRRVPGVIDRIVLVTESGELQLSPEEKQMQRDITISHQSLRDLGRPLADYLKILPRSQTPQTSPQP